MTASDDPQANLEALASVEPPNLFFEFKDDAREKIKMTYGLEMDIRRMLPDPGTAMELALSDPVTQDYIIRRCLTPVNKMVTDFKDLVPEDEVTIDADERDALLMWAVEHALYFFAKRTLGLARLTQKIGQALPNLQPQPLPIGSNDSASLNPSAGDLESPKAE
jgi:hypothetical protein